MKWFSRTWLGLKTSLWFIPSTFILLASGLALALIWLDNSVGWKLETRWPLVFGAGPEASRTLLAAIATSMIALAGVTFSITIVALTLAANQYTPRALRNFMKDRGNQVVLGTFVSIFVYCLLVLRAIRSEQDPFIPQVAVITAIGLALAGVAVFIYFIHHVAASIQVSSMLAGIMRETLVAVEVLYPQRVGQEEEGETTEAQMRELEKGEWQPVFASSSGYIQSIASEELIEFATRNDTVLRVEKTVGDFVSEGAALAWVPAETVCDDTLTQKVNRLFALNSYRTIEQDPSFGVRQIVDIALKALSPGVNDPATAISSLDHLEPVLRKIAQRRIPSPCRFHAGRLRAVLRGPTFASLLDQAVEEIRLNFGTNVRVICRLLTLLGAVPDCPMIPPRRQLLWKQMRLVLEQADEKLTSPHDRMTINQCVENVAAKLQPGVDGAPSLLHLSREPRKQAA